MTLRDEILKILLIFEPFRERTGYRAEIQFTDFLMYVPLGVFGPLVNGSRIALAGGGIYPESKTILFHAYSPEPIFGAHAEKYDIDHFTHCLRIFLREASDFILHEYCHVLVATEDEKNLPNLGLDPLDSEFTGVRGPLTTDSAIEQERMAIWLESVILNPSVKKNALRGYPPHPSRLSGFDLRGIIGDYHRQHRKYRDSCSGSNTGEK